MRSIATPGYRFTMGVLFTLMAGLLWSSELDRWLFGWLNSFGTEDRAILWSNITNLGDGLLATGIAIAMFSRLPRNLATVFVNLILVGLLVQLAKHGVDLLAPREMIFRPIAALGPDTVNVIGPEYARFSFPSGHSAAAASLATIACLKLPSRTMRSLVILIATLVGLSRAVVGVHWPSDIAAGALLGVVGAVTSVWLVDKVFSAPDYGARIGIYLLAIVVSVSLYQNHTKLDGYPGVDQLEYLVATVALFLCIFRLVETTYRRFRLSTKIKDLSRNELVVSFAKFGMVGASGFIVDISFFTMLHSLVGLGPEIARGIAYWIAATWNWFLNRSFTFAEAQKEARAGQWSKYLIMCLVSFFPNWGTFTLLTNGTEFFAQYTQLALVAGVAAGMIFNFLGARFIIFRHQLSKEQL